MNFAERSRQCPMDKLLRIVGLSLCITYSSYICDALKQPGKGLEKVAKMMADDKNKEVAALERKVADTQDAYLKKLRAVQDSIETAKQVQAIGEVSVPHCRGEMKGDTGGISSCITWKISAPP